MHATVESHGLDSGALYVPQNPRITSWLSYQPTGPGADHGTAIVTSHINYANVDGIFHDLGTYQVGQRISVGCSDGRTIGYIVVPAASMGFVVDPAYPAVVNEPKDVLDADLQQTGAPLHQKLFDQTSSFGPPGHLKSGRLLLVTCGGPFDTRTGNYLDNYYVYALPDAA